SEPLPLPQLASPFSRFPSGLTPGASMMPPTKARRISCRPSALGARRLPLPLFTRLPRSGLLGSSLSSGAARGRLRICHEALEDGIGDASLEAPQRLLTRFALRDLLAVVGFAPS